MNQRIKDALGRYIKQNQKIILAFLFGSLAQGRASEDSDVDIAVYLTDTKDETRIWREVSQICEREVDLIVLNDAPATLISNIIKTGIPLVIKNKNLYWRLYLEKSLEAEDFAGFAQSYWMIQQRAQSLSPEDKTRLLERLQFLQNELIELARFQSITFQEYQNERGKRRELERWAENIMNAMIDIAKILLASEKKPMPKTYEEALREYALFAGLSIEKATEFSSIARLRNLLAHEYLDILYDRIQDFIKSFPPLFAETEPFLKQYLKGG